MIRNCKKIFAVLIFSLVFSVTNVNAEDTDLEVDADSIKDRTQTVTAITDAYDADILTEEYAMIKVKINTFRQSSYDMLNTNLFLTEKIENKGEYEHIVSITEKLNMFTSVQSNRYKQSDENKGGLIFVVLSVALFLLLGLAGFVLARANSIRQKAKRN